MRILVSGVFMCCLFSSGCKKDVEDLQPQSDFEKSKDALPTFNFDLDSTGSKVLQFDSIAQGGNFNISLNGFKHCKLKIQNQGKTLLVEATGKNWKKDSSDYTICKNGTCRDGKIRITNQQYINPGEEPNPVDSCTYLSISSRYYEGLENQDDFISDNLFPVGITGTLNSISSLNYSATRYNDNTILYNTNTGSIPDKWGFDTIYYSIEGVNKRCYKGKIAITIGNTCEISAKDDYFTVTNGFRSFPEAELALNDSSCFPGSLAFTTRSTKNFGPGGTVKNTDSGSLDEGTENQTSIKREFKYTRTIPNATKDKFPYYLKNLITGRVTKAWVYLTLN